MLLKDISCPFSLYHSYSYLKTRLIAVSSWILFHFFIIMLLFCLFFYINPPTKKYRLYIKHIQSNNNKIQQEQRKTYQNVYNSYI